MLKIWEKMKPVIFVAWFAASMGALLCVGELTSEPVGWILFLFGQFFLVIGLLAVRANEGGKSFPAIILMGPIVGAGMMSLGLIYLLFGERGKRIVETIAPLAICLVFLLMGVLLIYMSKNENSYLEKRCTISLQAMCIDYNIKYSYSNRGRRKRYSPIYKIQWQDKEYSIIGDCYTNYKYEIGQYYEIKINPEDVYEFLDERIKSTHTGMMIIGIVAIVVSVFVFFLVIYGMYFV